MKNTRMRTNIHFKLWNNIAGAFVFLLSSFIYLSTLEPTVSFWDCGEFLSCDNGLEIAHPSGAPLVMLIRRMAVLLAGSDKSHIAWMVNATSGIASALTILFLFWTITWFGRKLLANSWQNSNRKKILILAAGFVGAMSYAVSDSFWFSAVEAEVYAMSSLFTALVFWCILKWEEASDTDNSHRWLVLIAYLFGLSIGVHLLNLLAIPAIVVLYAFRKYPLNWKNTLIALAVSAAILGGILYIIIPGLPLFFSWMELFCVNNLGLAYNSGFALGGIILVTAIAGTLYLAHRKRKYWVYNGVVYLSLIILGFSSYATIVIRSHDNPPVDMSNPEDPFALNNYLNREQYGSRPLLYGASFASPVISSKERLSYQRSQGKYVSYPLNPEYVYDNNTLMLFPRMASDRPGHDKAYKQWIGFRGKAYYRNSENGQQEKIMLPTFGENLRFFFTYQLGFMYFRYFMWNFAGRQNDIQGHGEVLHGNWISGIPFVDKAMLGPQDKLPLSLKNNAGRNVYFLLPLLLGLIGLVYHYKTDNQNFQVLGLLFFFTGIAIVIFLNEEPVTPRERDYVYVGSFYAFCVWIGLGIIALAHWVDRWKKLPATLSLCLVIGATLSVPTIMAAQNWDDHDRSGRYHALEYARNYLESCQPNAILFTNADNDTYPLWYAQEVESIRRDVRIVLLPYLSAYWYVDQLRKPFYQAAGIAMSLTTDKFIGGQRSFLPVVERMDSSVDVADMLGFVGSDEASAKVEMTGGERSNYLPTRKLFLKVDKEKFQHTCDSLHLADSIKITVKDRYMRMDRLVLLDILATNNWKRPVYFASWQEPIEMGLDKYLQLDGYAYKLTPHESKPKDESEIGFVETDSLYEKFMYRFDFRTLFNPKVYLDGTHISTIYVVSLRGKFAQLAEALIRKGQKDKAIAVLDKITAMLPHERVSFDYQVARIAGLYLQAGARAKGESLLKQLEKITFENLDYFRTLPHEYLAGIDYDLRTNLYQLQEIMQIARQQKLESQTAEVDRYWSSMENTLLPTLQR
jgi:hypothetical protein